MSVSAIICRTKWPCWRLPPESGSRTSISKSPAGPGQAPRASPHRRDGSSLLGERTLACCRSLWHKRLGIAGRTSAGHGTGLGATEMRMLEPDIGGWGRAHPSCFPAIEKPNKRSRVRLSREVGARSGSASSGLSRARHPRFGRRARSPREDAQEPATSLARTEASQLKLTPLGKATWSRR